MTIKVNLNGIGELDFPTGVTSATASAGVATVNLSSSSTLAADTDVSISSPADAQVLTFDGGSSLWKNKAATGGGGSSSVGAFTKGASIFTRNDVTASRVLGTAYQNTSGKWMIVSISIGIGSLSATLDVTSDASATPTTKVWSQDGGSGNLVPVIFLVKPGDWYKAALSAGTPNANNALWLEYTMNTATVTDSGDLGPSGTNTRSLTTTFQNTTGSPIIVAARITGMGAGSRVTGISDTAASPTDTVFALDSITSIITAFFWVPNGHFYKITAASGVVNTWHEYTIAGVACVKSANLAIGPTNGHAKRQFAPDIAGVNQTYVNNTGLDIWVAAPGTSANATGTFRFYVDPEPAVPPFIQQHQSTNNAGSGKAKMAQGIVQPGQSYAQTNDNGVTTIISWFEYQLGTTTSTLTSTATFYNPDFAPTAPSILNDEFNVGGPGLPAQWTLATTTSATVSYNSLTPGSLLFNDPGATLNTGSAVLQALPAGDYTVATKVRLMIPRDSGQFSPSVGIWLTGGTTANSGTAAFYGLGWNNTSGFIIFGGNFTNWGTFSTGLFSSYVFATEEFLMEWVYLRIRHVGTSYFYGFSFNGIDWTETLGSTAPTTTPTFIGLGSQTQQAYKEVAQYEFFRYWNIGTQLTIGNFTSTAGTLPTPSNFDSFPTSPNANNDEFETTSLNGAWTLVQNTVTSVDYSTTVPGSLYAKFPNTVSNVGYVIGKSFVPGSADFSVTLKGHLFPTSSFDSILLQVGDTNVDLINTPGTANGHAIDWVFGGSVPIIQLNKWVAGTRTNTNVTPPMWSPQVYLHIQRVGGTWTMWYSFDGGGSFQQATGLTFGTPTVNFVTVSLQRYTVSATGIKHMSVDFVRFNQLFL